MKTLAATLLFLLPLAAQPEPSALLEKKTLARIASYDDAFDGVIGVTAIDLTTGHSFSHNGTLVTTQASLIKVPILVTTFSRIQAGALKLDDVRDQLTRMIRDSDNEATNEIIKLIGMARVNAMMASLGLPNTRLRRIMLDFPAAIRNEENTSTPEEMARLIALIYREKVVSPQACQEMIAMMKLVRADFRGALPAGVESASKPGQVEGVHTEAGIVYLDGRPYVLSVMASMLPGDANPIRDIVEIVHGHFTRLAQSNRYGHRVRP